MPSADGELPPLLTSISPCTKPPAWLLPQVTCGPITGEPMVPPAKTVPPAKGKLFVPLTEAQKAQKRLIKANSSRNAAASGGGSSGALLVGGGGGSLADQEPVEFVHLKTWGRNYAVLQVGFDACTGVVSAGRTPGENVSDKG